MEYDFRIKLTTGKVIDFRDIKSWNVDADQYSIRYYLVMQDNTEIDVAEPDIVCIQEYAVDLKGLSNGEP